MDEEQRKKRRADKTRFEREKYARSEPERKRKTEAGLESYRLESPEQRLHRNALWRQAWAKRKRKGDLAKMLPEQRDREAERWAMLAPEQQQAEDLLAIELDRRSTNAIDDLGTDIPDRSLSEHWSYIRDKKVRSAVLKRAKGHCEFCGKPGFIKQNGKPYLETHHVISLANEGADKLTNVIALCPNDHREAHFGNRRAAIETEMILKLKAIYR